MTDPAPAAQDPPADSPTVRRRLVEALRLDLVGPPADHPLADERLPGWVRPSNWYLTGFLIPSGMPPERCADDDEDDDFDAEVPDEAGLSEESGEDRKAAKKGFFPSSIGLSFLVPAEARRLVATVRWGDYAQGEAEDTSGQTERVWRRTPRAVEVAAPLAAGGAPPDVAEPPVYDVSGSGGLQLQVVERPLGAAGLAGRIPPGARAVSLFLVNRRPLPPDGGEVDHTYAFQAEIEVRGDHAFLPRPDLRGARAGERGRLGRAGGRPPPRGRAGVRDRATAYRPTGSWRTAPAAWCGPPGCRAPGWRRR